jgi:hypothetical protein
MLTGVSSEPLEPGSAHPFGPRRMHVERHLVDDESLQTDPLAEDLMVINIGPSHPAMHGTFRLKCAVPEHDARVPSLAALWPAFDWQERETFDMYGIKFDGHPDLRRIYLYEEFVGYPLRKDYPKEKRQPLVRRDDLPISPIKGGQ